MAEWDRLQPGECLATIGAAAEDQEWVADQLAAATGENRWAIGQARTVLLIAPGEEPSDAAAVRSDGGAGCSAAGASRVQKQTVAAEKSIPSERFDATEPGKLNAGIESAKAYAKLSYDVGASGIRVFPNDFHKEVPHEKTIAQIAKALDDVGKFAADFGQQVRLENHGSAGRLTSLAKIFEHVTQPNARVKLNSDPHDAEGGEFARNFALVKDRLGYDLHCHMLDPSFPYQLQADLLIDLGWDGWWLVEQGEKVPDRVQAMIELREQFDKLVATSLKRA